VQPAGETRGKKSGNHLRRPIGTGAGGLSRPVPVKLSGWIFSCYGKGLFCDEEKSACYFLATLGFVTRLPVERPETDCQEANLVFGHQEHQRVPSFRQHQLALN
jgi:hypothetical protein